MLAHTFYKVPPNQGGPHSQTRCRVRDQTGGGNLVPAAKWALAWLGSLEAAHRGRVCTTTLRAALPVSAPYASSDAARRSHVGCLTSARWGVARDLAGSSASPTTRWACSALYYSTPDKQVSISLLHLGIPVGHVGNHGEAYACRNMRSEYVNSAPH